MVLTAFCEEPEAQRAAGAAASYKAAPGMRPVRVMVVAGVRGGGSGEKKK